VSKSALIAVKAAFGVVTGIICGFFGGGGGMIVVPFLEKALKMPTKRAHATAIFVILPVTAVSAAVYLLSGAFPWAQALPAAGGVLAGGVLGALLLTRLSNTGVQFLFAAVMVIAGMKMLIN
jgi:uncharacterized membrane protein YfcA